MTYGMLVLKYMVQRRPRRFRTRWKAVERMNRFWISSYELVKNLSGWCLAKGVTSKVTIVSVLLRNYEMARKDADSIADRILQAITQGVGNQPILLRSAKYEGLCSICGKKVPTGIEIYWDRQTKRIWHTGCNQPEQFFRKLTRPKNLTLRESVELLPPQIYRKYYGKKSCGPLFISPWIPPKEANSSKSGGGPYRHMSHYEPEFAFSSNGSKRRRRSE